jgi:DNA primase catalytic subunit
MEPWQISSYYINATLRIPSQWNLSRKHVRIQTLDGRFIKLNRFRSRLNPRTLREFCVTFAPAHVYCSVLDWLFPERVGKKYKANHCVPVGSGEYVIDVDAYLAHRWHDHYRYSSRLPVCPLCADIAKSITIDACAALEWDYRDVHIVISGAHGFHIHCRDFRLEDWTHINYRDLIKSHEVARYKFSKAITLQAFCFDRAHFILSVDPMRVLTVPNTLNAETGLRCIYVGDREALEQRTI